jgi:multiple sugar transport system substrate-binding protein
MPDDTTWTWEDYSKVAAEISAKSGGKYAGVQDYSFIEPVLNIYARQHGEQLFTEDGKVGVSAKTVESWFQRSVDQIASKAEPDASRSTEIQSAGVEGSLPATNTGGMAWFWSNQLPAISSAAGRDLVLLRAPGESEFKRTGQYLKPSMYYSVSSKSEHPEEAKLLVDFLVNSTQAGELILSDRGLPANSEVRDVVLPKLSAMDKVGAEYVESLEEIIVDGTPVPPVGSGEVPDITSRINSDVLFGKITPAEAAKRWISEVEAAIG